MGARVIFGEPFTVAIDRVENIGWNFPKPNSDEPWVLKQAEAKKILTALKKFNLI